MKRKEPKLKKYRNPRRPELKWRVYYSEADGRRVDQKFKTKTEADQFLNVKTDKTDRLGIEDVDLLNKETERMAVQAVRDLQPYGKTIQDAVQFFVAHLKATERSAKVKDLAKEFLLAMKRAGKSERYLTDLKSRLGRFVKDHGSVYASEVQPRMIDQWLAGLLGTNTTRNHYRRVLSAFFGWCEKQGACSENPLKMVIKAKAVGGDVELFTPGEMRTLLELADSMGEEYRDVLAMLCIGGFAGLRASEFERLSWEDVKLDRGFIDLSKGKTKTAQRRLVKIQPVLGAWLSRFTFKTGLIAESGFEYRLRQFREVLGTADDKTGRRAVQWKHNALRHGFASYLLAETENPGEVSLQLGHNNAGIVFKHYRELVTKEDAADYWALTPERVIDGEEPIEFQLAASVKEVNGV